MKRLAVMLVAGLALALATTAAQAEGPSGDGSSLQSFQHVWIVMMENTGYGSLIDNPNAPWINEAVQTYGLATSSYGVTHPSQPNYIAITSGSTHGVADDNDTTKNVTNLVDQLEAHGKTWRDYQQSLSLCNGDKTASSCGDQLYERKHNPFVTYEDVRNNQARMANVVDLSQLDTDLANGNVADFNFIAPDQCHDMHGRSTAGDCNYGEVQGLISTGDSFLRDLVHKITSAPSWTGNSVIFVTWDESDFPFGDTGGCCTADPGGGRVVTIVISNSDHTFRRSDVSYNHYSVLATIQDSWQLGCLVNTCSGNVPRMTDLVGS
jgi:hypothetical protein